MPILLGCLIALATLYQGWQAADPIALAFTLYLFGRGVRPPVWSLFLAAALIPGCFFTAELAVTIPTVIRAITLPTLFTWARRCPAWHSGLFALGIACGLAAQTGAIACVLHRPVRITGLTANASELGQVGMLLFLLIPDRPAGARWIVLVSAAVTTASALARLPIAAILLFGLAMRRPWARYALGVAGLAFAMLVLRSAIAPNRLDITSAIDARVDTIITTAPLTWHGFGAGSFRASTGLIRPHIVPLVAIYELGIFAVVPAALAAWAFYRRRIPWPLAASLAVLWSGTDEALALPFGHYILAALLAVWIPVAAGGGRPDSPSATSRRGLGPFNTAHPPP